MGGVEQAAEAVCIGHVGTGRRERDAGAARHLLARRRELNQLNLDGIVTVADRSVERVQDVRACKTHRRTERNGAGFTSACKSSRLQASRESSSCTCRRSNQKRQHGGAVIELHAFDDPTRPIRRVGESGWRRAYMRRSPLAERRRLMPLWLETPPDTPCLQYPAARARRRSCKRCPRSPLDWAHIAVTLVDDRWVPETDSASNAHLAHDTLLQNAASDAHFLAAGRHGATAGRARCRR